MTVLPRPLLVTAFAVIFSLPDISFGLPTGLQNVLDNTHRSQEYGYPTDFTRGIVPVSSQPLYHLCTCWINRANRVRFALL